MIQFPIVILLCCLAALTPRAPPHAEDGGDGLVVLTAGTGEGVVWGTVRHRVLEACASLGLPLLERAPAAADRSTWREAFLTNG